MILSKNADLILSKWWLFLYLGHCLLGDASCYLETHHEGGPAEYGHSVMRIMPTRSDIATATFLNPSPHTGP